MSYLNDNFCKFVNLYLSTPINEKPEGILKKNYNNFLEDPSLIVQYKTHKTTADPR